MIDEFKVRMLINFMEVEHAHASRNLRNSLLNIQGQIASALDALEDGKSVNAHLIANAAMITEEIARWNMARQIMPYLSVEEAK